MCQSAKTCGCQHHDAGSGRGPHSKQEALLRDSASRSRHTTKKAGSGNASSQSFALDSQTWVAVTMIEDDDLMFGGKPLSMWYEEDRRYSMADDSALSPGSSMDDEEELRRGRQRDRPQYTQPASKHQKKPHNAEKQQQ